MVNKSYNNTYRRPIRPSKSIYRRQLDRVILVLMVLIIILVIKIINNKTTNNIIEIIEENIYYDFSWQDDGKEALGYINKIMNNAKDSIEVFNMDTKKKILNKQY